MYSIIEEALPPLHVLFILPTPFPHLEEVVNLIIWLEDRVIRHYEVKQRGPLRDYSDRTKWTNAFQAYLDSLFSEDPNAKCPFSKKSVTAAVNWLLGQAILIVYEEKADKFNAVAADISCAPVRGKAANIIEGEVVGSLTSELEGLLLSLNLGNKGESLCQDQHEKLEHVVQRLPAAQSIMRSKLGRASRHATGQFEMDFPSGFEMGSQSLDQAAAVLKMLYVVDLRELQSGINAVLCEAQHWTANPKTDSRLGKVGR